GLDPKRAQPFNRTVVGHHFHLLKEVIEKNRVPWESVYNVDEKGCQRGGGRKASQRKNVVQSFMGQWNIGVNGPNDSDDCNFSQITSDFLQYPMYSSHACLFEFL
ncbi:hypothetical protein BJV78DRAFT_1119834, partial [Lactifluus subvellereus]